MRNAFLVLLIAICSCNENNPSEKPETVEQPDSTMFFQIKSYFENQIKEVNKTPYFIYKLETVNGKSDSAAINTEEFTRLSKMFIQPDINDPPLKKFYHESIFHDATTNSYTFSYTTSNKDLPVQNVDILLKDDAQTVKRIFIRRFYNYGDSTAIEQLSWKHNEQFQINRLVQPKNGKEISRQTTIVWNDKG